MYIEPTIEEAQVWANALRSGKFKQGKYKLENLDNSLCCLGVGCKVFIPKEKLKLDNGILTGAYPMVSQPESPAWLCHINHNFYILTGKLLSDLNDKKHFSFDEIADIIELVYVHRILEKEDFNGLY